MDIVKRKEGERILSKISDGTHVIALALDGKMKSSEELAEGLDSLMTYGKSKVASWPPEKLYWGLRPFLAVVMKAFSTPALIVMDFALMALRTLSGRV